MRYPPDTSPDAPPPAVPSPPKGTSSSSSSSRTSASRPTASRPPTGPSLGAPPKESQGRSAWAPSPEPGPKSSLKSHLKRNPKPHLRQKQLRWARVSLERERKRRRPQGAASDRVPSCAHSYSTAASVLRAGTGCWDPKLDRALKKFNEAFVGKVVLPPCWVGCPPLRVRPPPPDAPSVTCPKQCRRTGTLQSHFCNSDLGKKPVPQLCPSRAYNRSCPQSSPPNSGSSPALASSFTSRPSLPQW